MATRLRLPPLHSIKDILRIYKIHAMKRLSQNFLMDGNLTRKIVKTAGNIKDMHVLEVGPGPGGITRAILELGAKHLIVVEKDPRFMPSLETLSEASQSRMRIYQADILRFDLGNIFPSDLIQAWDEDPPNIHIIGNLPFNVSTPLIVKWLRQISEKSGAWNYGRTKLTLTFQKEVAERMVACRLHRQRTRLSVMCQNWCWVTHEFTIPGKAFVPKPDVDVAVVTFEPLKQPRIDLPFKLVEKVVRNVFHYRQKMCKEGVGKLFPVERRLELLEDIFSTTGISPETRSFELHHGDFNLLCHAYSELCTKNPGLYDYDYRSKESVAKLRQYRKIRRDLKTSILGQKEMDIEEDEEEIDDDDLMEIMEEEMNYSSKR